MTEEKEQIEYIIQGMIENGELEYFMKDGVLCIRHGKNWGKKVNKYPDIIAGKKINWINHKGDNQ